MNAARALATKARILSSSFTPGSLSTPDDTSTPNGRTIANLVICRLGDGGALKLASPIAACDLVADVMGYFAD